MTRSLLYYIALASCIFITCIAHESDESPEDEPSSEEYSTTETSFSQSTVPAVIRRKKNNCIDENRCPKNEEYVHCTQTINRPQYCSQRGQCAWYPQNVESCIRGCVCKEGFLRNNNGTCILEEDCDANCGVGEVLDECPKDCPNDYCPTRDGESTTCAIPDGDACPSPVCKCRFNYRRAQNGTCIPTIDCPPFDCSDPHEEFSSCPPFCPSDDCSQATPSGDCPPRLGHIFVALPCNPTCRCTKGYCRKNGKCVRRCKRTTTQCPSNEEVQCVNPCPPERTCNNRNIAFRCAAPTKPCEDKCVCKEGYYRNYLGTCIKKAECELCNKENEFFACDSACDNDCSTWPKESRKNCSIINVQCNKQCYCEDGYARDDEGNCIPVDECPKTPIQCPSNEELQCVNSCPPERTCKNRNIAFKCAAPTKPCENKCVCKEGYYRNYLGTCIKKAECELCKKEHEFFACDSACDNECSTWPEESRKNCSIINVTCNRKCYCEDGYARDEEGNCVPVDECPHDCPDNEVYNTCIQALCIQLDCATRNESVACPIIDPIYCKRGCVCKEANHYRNKDGKCVPEDRCDDKPPKQCSTNEELRCVNKCPPEKTCKNKGIAYLCAIPDKPCEDKCVSKTGYVRNYLGTCIKQADCDKCKKDHEFFACNSACDNKCSTWPKENRTNCSIKNKKCNSQCYCEDGYARDDNGNCIPVKKCTPTPPTCGDSEILDDCPTDCAADYCPTCEEDNKKCPKPSECPPPACKCRGNFRRADNGTCIPTKDCPPFDCSDKPNEVWTPCPPLCPTDACSLPRVNNKCPFKIGIVLECNPKCQCKDGYGRNMNGTCVPFEECPDLCPVNEEYNSCTQAVCRQQNCTNRDDPVRCPRIDPANCNRGCVCKENHYRNENGKCVPEDQCPASSNPTCDDNEILDNCPTNCASNYCPKRNEDNKKCPRPTKCPKPACRCRFNYRRAANGTCIPTRNCPPFDCSAKPNEKWTACPPLCPSDTCSLPRVNNRCPFSIKIILECNPKCQCKDGFGRIKNGTCVPFEECLNEEYNSCTQAVCRQQNCTSRDDPVSCPRIDPARCKRGCVCKENHYRNEKGRCVPEDQCPGKPSEQCSSNEELLCVYSCPPEKTCKTRDVEYDCAAPTKPCENKCVCKKGYFRNYLGTCITNAECDQCDKDNEFFACDSACDNECSTWPKPNRTNCDIQNIQCNRKCYCEDGYARDEEGNCIPVDKCPSTTPTCGDNEILDNCPTDCASNYCPKRDEDNKKCPRPTKCPKPACRCRFNHRRAANGTCIPTRDCPPFDCSAKPNEKWTPCPPLCPTDACGLPRVNNRCPFRIGIILECNPKCQCKEGYGRIKNGTCVPFAKCPDLCPVNEEYNSCTQAVCRQQNCTTRNDPVRCPRIDPASCKKGCVCKQHYYRNENGKCVPEDQCPGKPPKQCSSNEELRCVHSCPPEKTCKTRGIEYDCAAPIKPCENKCVCKTGYFRNYLGTCITNAECDQCDKDNEFFACDSACDNECSTWPKPNRTNCDIQNVQCNRKCYCEDGYARDEEGNCIPVDECPSTTPTCGDNEILDNCPNDCASNYCPKCDEDNINCPKPKKCPKPACRCRFNYRRAANGTCIPTRDCPPFDCSAKPNEKWTPCPPLCPTDACSLSRVNNRCPFRIGIVLECNPKCQCKDGYGRIKNGTCVPFAKCPDLCPVNEEYNSCTQAVCRQQNCTTRNDPVRCPRIDPASCKKGCVCKKHYYRNENGKCVPEDQCPGKPPKQCSSNEELRCVHSCPPEKTCITRGIEYDCAAPTKPCEDKCVCKKGYFRNYLGTCITNAECDQCKKKHEFFACDSACDNDCSKWPKETRKNCSIVNITCNRKCYCEDGYARDKEGNCIPVDKCPLTKPNCGDNEILDNCPTNCASNYCPKCDEDNKKCPKPTKCPKPACRCRFNYRRAANGTCIPTKDCPPFDCNAKANEEWTPCPPICPSDDCGKPRLTGICPFKIGVILECNPKCQCKPDYCRTQDGDCVPFEDCPDLCPINEEYNSCTQAVCRQQNCCTKNEPVACPRMDPAFCKRGCVCKENYYRNDNGTCVAEDECPGPVCPNPHEEYKTSRIPNCPLLGTCTSIVARIACDKPEVPGCVCKSGYLRNGNQASPCVPICDCPQMASAPDCHKDNDDDDDDNNE